MAKDNIQPDVLRSAEATPIAKLSPAIADPAALVVEGVVTVTWPYSIVNKSIAFILAERDPLHRRDKGQLRVEFHGAAGKALAASSLGGGDEVRLSLHGVAWEENQAWAKHPGILEWQLKFSKRLLLKIRRADTQAVDTIDVDAADEEEEQESLPQPREPSPTPSIDIEHTQFSKPLPRTPLSTIPSKRYAYESLGPGEYTSPAFIKRARVSYGSLFEGGFDIFNEEEPVKSVKKKKRRSRFSMNPTSWRYASQSPSPEGEQEQPAEEEEDAEPKLDDVEELAAEERIITPPPQSQPVMVDQGCQTREMSSSPTNGVQVIAESKSTGILLQPTPTHPWKHVGVDHVLQEPSPLSFDYAATQDVPPSIHESEAFSQPEMHMPHAGFDMSMDIDPSLQPHQADTHNHDSHPAYITTATEMQPPRSQEHGLHDAHLHDLAWVAETLAPTYPTVPAHNAHDFPQGSFDRSSFTLRASPSDETHTLVSAGHHVMEMHSYVQIDEARRVSSSSYPQQDGMKPSNSYPERYEEDTETATVTATLGREGRSSPPQEEYSTDESEEEEEEQESRSHRYYDWNTGRFREGYPEEEEADTQYAEYENDDEEEEEEGEEEEEEEEDEGEEVDSESEEESESEPESRVFNHFTQPAPPVSRPFMPIPKPAPAAPKEPIFISLLSDSEDDDDNAPATTQAKKEPSEEPPLHQQDEVHEPPSEQEDDIIDELVDEDVDESMDEHLDEAEDKSDVEEANEIRTVASRSSRRSSRISQLDGCDEDDLHQNEESCRDISHIEMDHPNLIISPKPHTRQQHVDIAESLAQVQDESPVASSPLQRRSSEQHELAAVDAADDEEIPTVELRGASESPAPEPNNHTESPAVESTDQVTKPSLHKPEEETEMTDIVEAPTQQPAANDDLPMEDLQSTTLETQPSNAEAGAEIDLVEQDVEMQDEVIIQPREETEVVVNEEDNQVDHTAADTVSKATGEPEVAAPSSPPATQTEPPHLVSMAVQILEEPEITEKQLPTPLETQQDDYENNVDAADVALVETPPSEEVITEDVKEHAEEDVEDEFKDADEDMDEEYEDAKEEGGDNDDDFAIEQQLMSEIQHYSNPLKAHDADGIEQTFSHPPDTLEEIEEIEEDQHTQQTQQHSQQSQHGHHGEHCDHSHHDHHHAHHAHHGVHDRNSRRAEPEMSIGLQSLRSHCRAKRLSSDSADSLLTDPSVMLARVSPTMAHRQCLLSESDYLPQRSPRSPRNKAEHSDHSIALAKSSPRESVSPKNVGASSPLRARRGVKGSIDASILLAQSFSPTSERSPASPTASFRGTRRKSDKSDLSVQLATTSFKGSQQQQVTEEGKEEIALDAAQDASANPQRESTPDQPTMTGHNLRSPRKPTAVSSIRAPSVASSFAEDGNMASLKTQLLRNLRTSLLECLPLKSLRFSLNKMTDILAVATLTPRQPHRPKHGPRGYMLELCLTDPSVAPTGVNIAHIFRPHQASLPTVQAGDVVLLRRVQVVSVQGRGFGIRAGDASAWAVFEKDDDEMLPQIKGPPVEVADEEVAYVQGLKRWWGLQDDKALAKIDKANQKMSQAVKDDSK
ncbi:hypothetical protein CI102_8316 [Trichoderma harzianum]|nr:hypothetical protein CI102_8316 [Trichoderma harzianum]